MAKLRKAIRRVEVKSFGDTKVHAILPTKGVWDQYTDELFVRDKDTGELVVRNSAGLQELYRLCIVKIEDAEIENDDGSTSTVTLTDKDQIVEFMQGLTDLDSGRELDSWLLNLGQLTQPEAKN